MGKANSRSRLENFSASVNEALSVSDPKLPLPLLLRQSKRKTPPFKLVSSNHRRLQLRKKSTAAGGKFITMLSCSLNTCIAAHGRSPPKGCSGEPAVSCNSSGLCVFALYPAACSRRPLPINNFSATVRTLRLSIFLGAFERNYGSSRGGSEGQGVASSCRFLSGQKFDDQYCMIVAFANFCDLSCASQYPK
jgi:hypothetical protein